jgi:hypothetical protein
MTKEQCKYLVGEIFGDEAANDEDIVQFYLSVNQTAMSEYAQQMAIGFNKWVQDNYHLDSVGFYHNDYQNKVYFNQTELYQLYLKTLDNGKD